MTDPNGSRTDAPTFVLTSQDNSRYHLGSKGLAHCWDWFLQQLPLFAPSRHARGFPRWVWASKTWSISIFTRGLKNLQ